MKRIFTSAAMLMCLVNMSYAQNVNSILKGLSGKHSASTSNNSSLGNSLSNDDIAGGLKEALNSGVQKGTAQLSQLNGFFANAAIKILLPFTTPRQTGFCSAILSRADCGITS